MSRTVTLRETSTDLSWFCPDCGQPERLVKKQEIKAFSFLRGGFETLCFYCHAAFTTEPETPASQIN